MYAQKQYSTEPRWCAVRFDLRVGINNPPVRVAVPPVCRAAFAGDTV